MISAKLNIFSAAAAVAAAGICVFSASAADAGITSSMTNYPADGRGGGRIVHDYADGESAQGPFGDISSIVITGREVSGSKEFLFF
ncbi:MAG: hypothetical protein ACRCUT_10435, partial [Spirochaetota bacterium]